MESIAYEELLKRDGKVITHVVGSSMLPLLHDRESIVIVEDAVHVPPRKGDVVLYKNRSVYVLHRILKVTQEEYLIRGDNTRVMEHVPKSCLLATMTGFYRYPESRLISRDHAGYRLYRLMLPCIRIARRGVGIIKHVIRKVCKFLIPTR